MERVPRKGKCGVVAESIVEAEKLISEHLSEWKIDFISYYSERCPLIVESEWEPDWQNEKWIKLKRKTR